jgi:hypothetical protein
MANPFITTLSKLARKLVMALLIAALALVAYSVWVFIRDQAGYEERRVQRASMLTAERGALRADLKDWTRKHAETTKELETQQLRLEKSEKVLKTLDELDPGALDRILGDVEQRKTREAKIARMEMIRTEARTRVVELQSDFVVAEKALAETNRRLAEVEKEEAALKKERHAIEHYLRSAWEEAHSLFITVFFVCLFGGLVAAILLYYIWAPWLSRGRTVELPSAGPAMPTVSESAVVMDTGVWPGEVLWVKKRFFQGGDAALTRRKRLMLTWRMPLSCLMTGLVGLIELRNGRSDGERRVAFASTEDHFAEFVVVSVPDGSSFMLRAHFLKGIIAGLDQPPVIRRCWRFFRWQSWVTGQFGYIQFHGPCRLIVSCPTALQVETLAPREEGKPLTQLASEAGVIGLGPRLVFKAVRSAGFMRYCRGESSLFDMEVTGSGVVLWRDSVGRGRDNFIAEVLKVVGL